MTALTIVQQACGQLGQSVPTTVFGNTQPQVIQLASLLNQEGLELSKENQWEALTREKIFTSTATQLQVGAIPTDFSRFVNDSMWNRTTARPCKGPITEQQWQMYEAFPIYTNVNPAFLLRGGNLYFQPAASSGATIAYSYVTKYWCTSSTGTEQTEFAADSDICLLPEDLMILGLKWRWLKAKGFDYAEEYRTYMEQVAQTGGRDGGAPRLNMVYGLNRFSPFAANILQGNWPGNTP